MSKAYSNLRDSLLTERTPKRDPVVFELCDKEANAATKRTSTTIGRLFPPPSDGGELGLLLLVAPGGVALALVASFRAVAMARASKWTTSQSSRTTASSPF